MTNSLPEKMSYAIEALRSNNPKDTARWLTECVTARSLDYVVHHLRQHCASIHDEMQIRQLGKILKGPNIRLRPAAMNWTFSQRDSVYIVGSSFVRAFGLSPRLIPVFIGKAINCNAVTDEAFDAMRQKYAKALARLPPGCQLILPVGIDASLLVLPQGRFMKKLAAVLKAMPPEQRFEAVSPGIESIANRYAQLCLEARRISDRIFVVLAPPTIDQWGNRLTRSLNDHIVSALAPTDIKVIDLWNAFTSSVSGLLDTDRFGLPTILDDFHYNEDGARLILDAALQAGLCLDEPERQRPFEWTHVFTMEAGLDEPFRIWCEPAVSAHNALTSGKIAASYVADRFAEILTGYCLKSGIQEIGWLNTHDGYLPFSMPAEVVERHSLFECEPSDIHLIDTLVDFTRRYDVTARPIIDAVSWTPDVDRLCCCVIQPQDVQDRADRILDVLKRWQPKRLFAMADPRWIERLGTELNLQPIRNWPVGVNHLRQEWRTFQAALFAQEDHS